MTRTSTVPLAALVLVGLLVAAPLVATVAVDGAAATAANQSASPSSDSEYSLEELKRDGARQNVDSVRMANTDDLMYWLVYWPANDVFASPGGDEGGIYTLNAARSFQTFVREVDNLLVFDNDAWRKSGESMEGGYEQINDEIVRRFGVLFGAGEVGSGDEVAESVVDSSEIINTLSGGGVSTVGYAAETVEEQDSGGLLSRFKGDDDGLDDSGMDTANTTNRITSLVRKAALGRLTLPCEIDGAERALLVMSGPSNHLNRKGIERGRKWLEEQTGSMEVRGGDYPVRENNVAASILLSGVHNVPRIKELQQVAIEAQDNIDDIRQQSEENLEDLVEDDEDELDPLF